MPNSVYRATHINGSVTTTPTKIVSSKSRRGFHLKLTNLDAIDNLEISFNSGRDFYPIRPLTVFDQDVAFHFFYLRASAGAVTYSGLIFEG